MPGALPEPSAPQLMGGEPVLVSIGDISVTATQVFTPSGTRPLAELQWTVTDMSLTNEGIPTWAIVCAIIFLVFCLLGLLFLLVKETSTKGSVQVTVHGPGFVHTTQMGASHSNSSGRPSRARTTSDNDSARNIYV